MTRLFAIALLMTAAGCVTDVAPDRSDADASIAGINESAVRESVAADVRARLGDSALAEIQAAESSVMASFHQGMPKPIQRPDGSWTYEPPYAGAAIRTRGGWAGWKGGVWTPLPAAASAEIDRLLADPAFWRESDYDPPTCTDSGAQFLAVLHLERRAVRQQSCSGRGLTRRLFELVLNGP